MTPSSNMSLREVSYTPSVPSPLNPSSPDTPSSTRRPRRGSYIRVARKMGGQLSPTQRLMRQKAAAAWRSMTLRSVIAGYPSINHEINFIPPPAPSLGPVPAPVLAPVAVTVPPSALAPASAPAPVLVPKQATINRDTRESTTRSKTERPVTPVGEYHDIDLDDVETGTEKQPLIACEEGRRQVGGLTPPSSETAKYSSYKRSRQSKVLTRRRVLTAVGILCAVGLWTAVRPSGSIHGR
ncbi:hypothetical protein F4810DRAFT_326610 [Camillea tinctor]|nr:hypothetical protein F4810DRAFT_326610 [Camillea tinctor]